MQRASVPGAIVGIWQDGREPYARAFGVLVIWKDVLGEDKSEQTIAEMRADGRLTQQDRLIICSWRRPEGFRRWPT
jgi:hypothetical protein